MNNPLQLTIVLGLAAAGVTLAASDVNPPSKSEAAAVRDAVQFERAKDAAARRQLGIEAHPGQASEANRSEADRSTAEGLTAEPQAKSKSQSPQNETLGQSIRFEKLKDAAAARQMRLDARQAGKSSPVLGKTEKTKP
ncbi:MAG TPA: hypothetical protein VNY05_12075 [Candidatus Acidoferrales bacterium]|jgi:hypothetical protein|nr:hypothetical protein [Candidatus Acidoferrales bacterium]